MTTRHRIGLVALGFFAVTACTPPAADTSADQAVMRDGTKAWVDAYNAGDADKIVALYAEAGVVMPPDAPAVAGHDALRRYLVADIASSKAAGLSFMLGEESAGVSGDLGWHSGTYKVNGAGGATVGTGKYLEVWRKAEGKWLIIRDVWNNDAPAAVAPTK
jgi:ketosteroid isomerase-like protein